MSFEINSERKAYLEAKGKIVLSACPGSGKTTAIAHKLSRLTKDWNATGGIACLSFTNTAKDEILDKYRELSGNLLGYPHCVSTIDSFVNQNITLPYAHKLIKDAPRFRLIDDKEALELYFDGSFRKKNKAVFHSYHPADIHCLGDGKFGYKVTDKSADSDFVRYAKLVKEYQWKKGLLTSSDSIHLAIKILNKFPRLATYLSYRYPVLIVDEAQDTSELQYVMLDRLVAGGLTHLELIGDPYQCLYEWRNASPSQFIAKYDDKANWQGLDFSENFRSTSKIIQTFSGFRRSTDKPITCPDQPKELPVHILRYKDSCTEILDKYEKLCSKHGCKKNKVLVRGGKHLDELNDANEILKPWKSGLPYLMIRGKLFLDQKNTREAFRLIKRCFVLALNPSIDYRSMREKEEEMEQDIDFNAHVFRFLRRIPSFDLTVTDWTAEATSVVEEFTDQDGELDFNVKKAGFKRSKLLQPMKDFFSQEVRSKGYEISTIHKVKGMTLDSAVLVLAEKKHVHSITIEDFEKTTDIPTEKQSMIYVALSRPQKLLCIGAPASVTEAELKRRFGDDIKIE